MAYDPFSESTRKTKRNLLAVSFVGILYSTEVIDYGYNVNSEYQHIYGFFIKSNAVSLVLAAIILYLLISLFFHFKHDEYNSTPGVFFSDVKNKREASIKEFKRDLLNYSTREIPSPFNDAGKLEEILNLIVEAVVGRQGDAKSYRDTFSQRILDSNRASPNQDTRKRVTHDIFDELVVKIEQFNSDEFSFMGAEINKYEKFSNNRKSFEIALPSLSGVAAMVLLLFI